MEQALVLVVDHLRQYVEEVSPAVARYALRANRASVLYKHPFTIQLPVGVSRCPRPPKAEPRRARAEVVRVERQIDMSLFPQTNAATAVNKFNAYFKNNTDETVWVRAIQPPGQQGIIQHSITVKESNNEIYRIPPIQVGDPVELTLNAPFEALKRSTDLRRSVVSGILELLTTEEAHAFLAKKSAIVGKPIEQLKAEQQARDLEFLSHQPLVDDRKPTDPTARAMHSLTSAVQNAHTPSENPVLAEEKVKPFIIHLCQQVNPMLKEEQCMPANELLARLQSVAGSLTLDDWEHVYAHGRFKSVKQYAQQQQAELAKGYEIDDVTPRQTV